MKPFRAVQKFVEIIPGSTGFYTILPLPFKLDERRYQNVR
jgi:hypothetical protein